MISPKQESWLSWFFRGLLILVFIILIARLGDLQIIKGDYFRSLSNGNRIRRVIISAPRGKVFARGGEVLIGNRSVKKSIIFNPEKGYEKKDFEAGDNVNEVITEWERFYPLEKDFAHVGGYVGEVNTDEVGKINPDCSEKGYRKLGSLVGRSGLEKEYECLLSGIDGEELIEVDTTGKMVRVLGRRKPVAGQNIKTNINFDLQKKVASLLDKKDGAIIVTDSRGAVLALYSSPSFDPNVFIRGEKDKISILFDNPDKPFFNRAISGRYHPGSVFKPVVVIAGLEEKKIDADFIYDDPGEIVMKTLYGTFSFSNWYFSQYGKKEGEIDVVRAIARSTDTFFYKVGELVGVNNLVKWAGKFGLSEKTGIDLPGEISGLIPSPEWKEKVKHEKWFLGNTYHMSIGQGDIGLSPILIDTLIAAIAEKGSICSPKIVGETKCKDINIDSKNVDIVKKGMIEACQSGGTGYTFFDADPKVACKTGTAEIGLEGKTHAWFVFFAPSDFPEIVTTVLVEKGGEGSKVAGPIAREIYNYWFGKEEKK